MADDAAQRNRIRAKITRRSRPHDPDAPTVWQRINALWIVRAAQAALWAALLTLAILGVVSITSPRERVVVEKATVAEQVPETAQAFVAACARDYLTWNEQPEPREAALRRCFAPALVRDAAWLGGETSQTVEHVLVETAEGDRDGGLVTVRALTASGDALQWRRLQFPVHTDGQRHVITALPATLGAPQLADAPVQQLRQDPALARAIRDDLEAFFAAYADGRQNDLDRMTLSAGEVTGLDGTLDFSGVIANSVVVTGDGDERTVTLDVLYTDPATGADVKQTYQLPLRTCQAGWCMGAPGAKPPAPASEEDAA